MEIKEKNRKKAIEERRKQLFESNELIKEDFNIRWQINSTIPLNKPVEYKAFELKTFEKKINPDNLVYK